MPRIPKDQRVQGSQQQSWASRIRAGKVVPLISNSVSADAVLGGHTALVKKYAEHIIYPLKNEDDLPRMIQFKSVIDDTVAESWDLGLHYVDFIKNHLFDIAEDSGISEDILAEVEEEFDDLTFAQFSERIGYPQFGSLEDPLLLLASFPLPIYLTTSYHGFLEMALKRVGKKPRTEICHWHDSLSSIPSVFDDNHEPTQNEPIVYHLLGYDEYPNSLVLTVDNYYLEFLVAISEYRGKDEDRIAGRIRQALAECPLVLLGYNLESWDFRTLFWGLIMPRPRQLKSVAVQLRPGSEEERYLVQYLAKTKFDVIWTDTNSYLKILYQEMGG
jgi:hypothetical protein